MQTLLFKFVKVQTSMAFASIMKSAAIWILKIARNRLSFLLQVVGRLWAGLKITIMDVLVFTTPLLEEACITLTCPTMDT
jgi:hypothetical protein